MTKHTGDQSGLAQIQKSSNPVSEHELEASSLCERLISQLPKASVQKKVTSITPDKQSNPEQPPFSHK